MKYAIDYENLRELAGYSKTDFKNLSLALGKSHGYLSSMCCSNGRLKEEIVQEIALLLDCRPSDFIDMRLPSESEAEYSGKVIAEEIEPKLEIKPSVVLDPADMESEIEKFIREKFGETLSILEELTEKVNSLAEEFNAVKESESFEGQVTKASTLLSKMLDSANGGSVKLNDFKSRCSVIGITDREVIKQAIESAGCETMATGLGNDKIVWVYKEK